MSTTRPLLGMKRVTEVTCSEKPGNGPSHSGNKQLQDALTVDEFAVFENKQEELRCARPRVEQVFKVAFTIIGLLDHADAHKSKASRQIWLQLKGKRDDVSNAKEYLKGLCDPELQEEQHYPVDMHCIFAGARGLFLDQLLRDTSADVLVAEPGHLRLLGRAEPVVMAQTRVQQFVALFQGKQSLPSDREQRVKRAFKAFVEERDDKYTMELLLLPSALKEELLGLAHSPTSQAPSLGQAHVPQTVLGEPDQDRSQSSTPVTELSNRILDTSFEDRATTGAQARVGVGAEVVILNGRHSHKRRSSENETRDTKRQYSLERRDESLEMERQTERQKKERESRTSCHSTTPSSSDSQARAITVSPIVLDSSEGASDDWEAVSPETNLRCLVNFFRTMGYQQELVERVIRETGQSEDTFLLLERIVEETQLCNTDQIGGKGPKSFSSLTSSELPPSSSAAMPCSQEIERRVSKSQVEAGPTMENARSQSISSNSLGHRRIGSNSVNSTQAVALKRTCNAPRGGAQEVITIDDDIEPTETTVITGSRQTPTIAMEHLESQSGSRSDFLSRGGGGTGAGVTKEYISRGGTQTLGGSVKLESVTVLRNNPHWLAATTSAYQSASSSSYQTISYGGGHSRTSPLSTEPLLPPVTGMNRFLQSLKTPYTLTLPNELGKPEFRHIIIDGSNVAMAHGLNRFFSCRGIAIAVESFWRRGHREITVFVPQWRQKRDRFTTEQHFLNQLEDLRLLSFTPSREVCGQRISSHDDRFLLHLAEKTGGVIVTNDNLRDFVNTSDSWRRIIQESLLQFTFVEDLFMIPDDPLGKHGPHLETFLCKNNRRPPATPPQRIPPEFQSSKKLVHLGTQPPNTPQPCNPPPHHQLGPTPSFNPGGPSHWPNSGPPDWHPPRSLASPSTSTPPQRMLGETLELKRKLYNIFPDQKQRIDRILSDNPYMRDLNALSALLLG